MRMKSAAVTAALVSALSSMPAEAYEFGYPGWAQKPGIVVGNAATAPPPGLYMFNQVFTYQANIVGPGAPNVGGSATPVHAAVEASGLLWVPGWTFLGGTYNAVVVQPFIMADVGGPLNLQQAGMHNTYIVPAELSWRLGDSGVFVKAGLGIYVPNGTVTGINGLGNVGNPWWTFQPEIVVSYLKDGWNLTANVFQEMNTRSTVTNYRSGDVLHAEFTATKTIGNWTIGPVAYYVGQVSNDQSSSFYGGAINVNRYNIWAAGALVGYNFGPATLNVWAFDEISAHASGGTPIGGADTASITKGWSVFASLSYRLWAPDEPAAAPKRPQFFK
ncbi:transporter [Bradyrhizobium sp. U87765 SZCCT0131]|uniref:SphA family protein n=1 Tax=unclassified Bradyrhizobium TaxID=2631580 RepID=UPI001BA66D9A|nr:MULTISPECIES: transporter [unclassified Bradyrhizobium]MBR1218841.1 transporter [Bradyrhizobium sp. U87765 SZCCT0131]MBR1261492.1 transporter [Bradyrhizobium sp. U87765 SZCCT0134]MBR1306655.1 transporter [Bradyrhizobium sp. U87765 SZCCT0110]MBR1317274.1 transporter [Bradyrhizobium sp. U87765 SZCCT0109]MBR1350976.1 transporter [Bradyrhizobium sp. U87765 SZCCT0048]